MGAKADAIRVPGHGPTHRSPWYVVATLVVVAAIAVTLFAMVSRHAATAPDRVAPPATQQQAGDATAGRIQPNTTVVQVGGTSIYRFHPLPGAGTGFELVQTGTGAGGASHGSSDPLVGGPGAYRYHPLP